MVRFFELLKSFEALIIVLFSSKHRTSRNLTLEQTMQEGGVCPARFLRYRNSVQRYDVT